ncbi:MAG: PilX N-terminal domain-containing pilus assembly protein [Sinobacteraceae bacterium]|nr:PilX N-terminal domain-containing pilus assembly protein [Nevskiaceae bacterium]
MSPRRRQRGAASLVMGLLILLALSVVTLLGAHVVLTEHRMVRNDAAADTAFAVAEAGLQAGQAYLLANRTEILDATWHDCSTSDTAPPCGDGNDNQRGAGWQYLGPVQHLPPLGGNVPYTVWYLSNTLGSTPQTTPWIGCQQLSLLSGGPTSTMLLSPIFEIGGTLATTLIDQVNGLVDQATSILNGVLNTLIGTSPILPGSLGIPNKLCLPINFTQMSRVPRPSRINPTLYILAQAETATGGAGAVAQLQQGVQATSIYARSPLAAIMAGGDANLVGDVRVWGNPRPPTTPPYDFSTLNLNNLNPLGLPVSDLVDSTLAPLTTSLAPLVAPLLDPALGDQLDTDSTTLLSLQANVTFPLSIWAGGTVYLLPEPGQPAQVKTSHIGGVIGGLLDTLGLGGLVNGLLDGINNMLNGLLCVLGLCSNPDPMVPNPAALLNSARTCLPQWPGNQVPAVTGAPRDACLPLSQTITVLQGMIDPGAAAQPAHCEKWLLLICVKWSPATPGTNPDPPNDLSIPLKLPDV